MSISSYVQSFKRHSVPLVIFVIVAASALIIPPLVLGEVTVRTYGLTAAVFLLAVSFAAPYAVLVALGTLPLLYSGIASFAAPRSVAKALHPFSAVAALRHAVAGISYVLGAAVVGAIGIGVGRGPNFTAIPAVFQSSFLYLGGVIVAVVFTSLQLWRYNTPSGGIARRTVLGTVALGILLAPSPVIALLMFNRVY